MDIFSGLGVEAGFSIGLAAAAGLAGLTSSLHCFGMCGPLACAGCPSGGRHRRKAVWSYQAGRVATYTLVGVLLGATGAGASSLARVQTASWLPWFLAALLATSALGLTERLPTWNWARRRVQPLLQRSASFSPPVRACILGASTPLLPCGLLYALYATIVASGSAAGGATMAAGFALGGVPALLLAQVQTTWIQRLPRGSGFVLRRMVPLAAAGVLVWRAMQPAVCVACG